jgi:hypothetical protein
MYLVEGWKDSRTGRRQRVDGKEWVLTRLDLFPF